MTSAEIRNEIYNYIHKNIVNQELDRKQWLIQQKAIGKLLKKFTTSENPEKYLPRQLTPQQRQENDIKRGIWRPKEFYYS